MRKIFEDTALRRIEVVQEDEKGGEAQNTAQDHGNQNFQQQSAREVISQVGQNRERSNHQSRFFMESLRTADPVSLLLMCYSLAKSSIKKAIEGIEKKNYEMKYEGVSKALQVFDVLMAVTEPNEVGKQLISSYLFITQKITEADMKKDTELFLKVIGYIEELERAWKEARKSQAKKNEKNNQDEKSAGTQQKS